MGKALYRKYRPTTLDEVVGQEGVTQALKGAVESDKISHAYLFIGPRGCGKTSVARIFAHLVNGFDYQLEDNYIDIIEIDAASNTGVDNIRELREKAMNAPSQGKYRVYIIDEVHMLSKSAFGALLKIMEEPPKHVIFMMATTDPWKVPTTISSRAQTFTFKLADNKTMLQHLKKIAEAEKIKIDEAALEIIVRRGGGSFRDSISLLDQISTVKSGKITAEDVEAALGLPQDQEITELLNAYGERNAVKITAILKDLLNASTKPELIAEELMNRVIESPKAELIPLLKRLPEVDGRFTEAKLTVALLEDMLSATPMAVPKVAPSVAKTEPTVPKVTKVAKTEPVPEIAEESPQTTTFNWAEFKKTVGKESAGVGNILEKCECKMESGAVHIYAKSSTYYKILKTNIGILEKSAKDYRIMIDQADKKPEKSAQFSQISDIMGDIQEVESTDGNPFR